MCFSILYTYIHICMIWYTPPLVHVYVYVCMICVYTQVYLLSLVQSIWSSDVKALGITSALKFHYYDIRQQSSAWVIRYSFFPHTVDI